MVARNTKRAVSARSDNYLFMRPIDDPQAFEAARENPEPRSSLSRASDGRKGHLAAVAKTSYFVDGLQAFFGDRGKGGRSRSKCPSAYVTLAKLKTPKPKTRYKRNRLQPITNMLKMVGMKFAAISVVVVDCDSVLKARSLFSESWAPLGNF